MSHKLEKKIEKWRERAEELKRRRDPQKAADLVKEGVDLKREVDEKIGELAPEPPKRRQ
jgi:hypothetical protein